MGLEHGDAPRYTSEQRDEILNLANRLQAQHEGTIGADEMIRAAEEAGIDPRFVHEAAMRLGRKSRPVSRVPLVCFGLFVFQACAFLFTQNIWIAGLRGIASHEVMFAAGIAFVLGLWASRDRAVRWYVPLATLVVWISVGIAMGGLARVLTGQAPAWIPSVVVTFGLIQAIAALCGAAMAAALDRAPEGAEDFRLYRQ